MAPDDDSTNPSKTVVTAIPQSPLKAPTARDACLVVIYGEEMGRRVTIANDKTVIGRSSKCDLQVDQEAVSRNHAQITFDGKSWRISDLGSTNGTYVNDDLIEEEVPLRDGDQVKIGRTIFKFISGGNVEGQYHEEIYRLMTVDGLTEVHNKRFFHDSLEKETSRSKRYERTFSIVMFDIDHFKNINDTHGHLAGDAVLRQLGVILRQNVRRDDIAARVGGEEFGVILPEIGRDGAALFAEKLRAAVEGATFRFESTRIRVTISLGLAQWGPDMKDGEEIVRVSDDKLYEAKRSGRNKVCG